MLLALGLKKTLEYVGDEQAHSLADPLKGVALIALVGGTVMHLLAKAAFRWRTTGRLGPAPLVAAALIAPLALLGPATPALATLAAVTVITVAVETRRRSAAAR